MQGLFGLINSWYIGWVFLHCAVTHGLWTAMLIHAVYDILVFVIEYVGRKCAGKRDGPTEIQDLESGLPISKADVRMPVEMEVAAAKGATMAPSDGGSSIN